MPEDPDCASAEDDNEAPEGPVCGDQNCEAGEDCNNCEADCGACPPVCGNGDCEAGEDCASCVEDCGECDSCSDTDGGIVAEVQGTIYGYDDGTPYNSTDFCLNNATLMEYWCSGVNPSSTNITCLANMSQVCVNGACV